MARVRYTTNDPGAGPPGRAGALMPIPAGDPKASTGGLVELYGQPGTRGIMAPKPTAIPPNSYTRTTQPSYVAPDMIWPSTYYTTPANMHPPVALVRTNPMPVPAQSVYQLARISQRMRRVGGQSQIGQPQVVQSWPQWRGNG
jgi:hypothetical protein